METVAPCTDSLEKTSGDASEYDSAGSYSDEDNKEPDSHEFSGSESDERINFEREEGDGQESVPVRKVDDDEDKKNPQYIPKRGTFYEHDDRTIDDGDGVNSTDAEKLEKEGKKKVWQDKRERWSHDKFNDTEQAPKTRAELISIYGYDIRNEDGPPRARRRRRYGRGPNKYTRNWEDEDAYGKPVVVRKTNKKPRPKREHDPNNPHEKEFESQDNYEPEKSIVKEEENNRIIPVIIEDKPKTSLKSTDYVPASKAIHAGPIMNANQSERSANKFQPRPGTGRVMKPKREITDSDYKGFTKSRQYKSSKSETKIVHKPHKEPASQNQNQNNKNVSIQDLERETNKLSIQDGNYKSNSKHNNQRQASVPPRLQGEQKGSKRYSSIRQRSLPETAAPPFNQHPNYYGNDYSQQGQVPQQQPNLIQASAIHPASTQIPQIPPPLPPLPAQVPVTNTPILQGPPQFAPPFPQAPPFLQAGVAAAPFIPQQTAPIINYVQSQPQFPQAAFQGYQQQFNPVSQPTDLFQPQGGITYYSTQEQQITQRVAPLKRPTAAIPIVAPPEQRGRGRNMNQVDTHNVGGNETATASFNEAEEKYDDVAANVAQ